MVRALVGGLLGLIPLVVLAAWVRRGWVLVRVRGRSMLPTFAPGDSVLVRRISWPRVRAGDVVVVEQPVDGGWRTGPLPAGSAPGPERAWIIKRAAGVPGGVVPPGSIPGLPDDGAPVRVPAGRFVLLGDNPDGSLDSRESGYYPAERVLGRAVRVRSAASSLRGRNS